MRDIHCIRWGGVVCLNTPDLSTIMSLGWINQDELQWLLNGYDFFVENPDTTTYYWWEQKKNN